ncbi:hypothetical protein P872_17875 [Rhodonellum psychrophilum GCM71 = DSM 17998]|uniref:Clp protease ClpB n=2 Tax=Rhodonellum TaxID=336827 RepID=U5BY52_9BACT|nr:MULTISPECIES: hypothetical protein [Rhodonellum]ERM82494.1 hypothetical protein P872_17875 [Rhodonellum psychrophilum GCM71 = DSM 17998]MDO9553657.1 Clp protease ClpB [Rhodonellum sp.]
MKKLILVFMLFSPLCLFAQAKLDKMVNERNSLHQQWRTSENKKTGIFGNRTKKDMVETNDWMERIIQKDNQIMDELKLMSEIEKTEITYEKNDYKFISQKQEREITQLKRALTEKEEVVNEKKSDKRVYEWTTLIFFLSTVVLGYKFFKRK